MRLNRLGFFALGLACWGCLALPEGPLPDAAHDAAGQDAARDAARDAGPDAAAPDGGQVSDAAPDAGPPTCTAPTLELTSVLPAGALGAPQVVDVGGDGVADLLVPAPDQRAIYILHGHPCGLHHGRLEVVDTVQPAWAVLLTHMGDRERVLVALERVDESTWRIELYLPEPEGYQRDPTSTVPLPPLQVSHLPAQAPTLMAPLDVDDRQPGGLVFGYFRELWTLPSARGPALAEGLRTLRREDGQFFEAVGLVGVASAEGGDALLVGEQTGYSLALNAGAGVLGPARSFARGHNLKTYEAFDLDGDGRRDLVGAHVTEGGAARVFSTRLEETDVVVDERVLPPLAGLTPGTGPLVWDLAVGQVSEVGPDVVVLAQGEFRADPRLHIATRLRFGGVPETSLGVVAAIDLPRPGQAVVVGPFDATLPGDEVLVLEHETNDLACWRWRVDRIESCRW